MPVTTYAFGDSDLARERLALVADTFAAPTRAAARRSPGRRLARYVIDMGCGPGTRPRCCGDAIPHASRHRHRRVGGDGRRRRATAFPARAFAVADVTAPLRLPADLVYARLLLGHLPDPGAALARWAAALRAGGSARVRGTGALPQRRSVVRALRGGRHRGRRRARAPRCGRARCSTPIRPAARACSTGSSSTRCARGRAAAMFWRNAATWGGEVDGADALIERAARGRGRRSRRRRHVGAAPDRVGQAALGGPR